MFKRTLASLAIAALATSRSFAQFSPGQVVDLDQRPRQRPRRSSGYRWPRPSSRYEPHQGEGEKARRRAQIAAGRLKVENGLREGGRNDDR